MKIRRRETPNLIYRGTFRAEHEEVINADGLSWDDFQQAHDSLPDGAFWAMAAESGFDPMTIAEVYGREVPHA